MRKFFLASIVLLAHCNPVNAQFSQDGFKVLVFSKTAGYRHQSIEAGKKSMKDLAEDHQFQVAFSENSRVFDQDSLFEYSVIIFLNTTLDILNEKQQQSFKKFIRQGGGFVGIHSAADTEYGWDWYGNMIGAYFKNHPGRRAW